MFKTKKNKLIELDKICFGYEPKKTILSNVSFSLNEKEYVCIIGPNGCGKSTLGKLLVGLFKPNTGKIIFNNKVIDKTNVRELRNSSGLVFENPDNQFIGLTLQDDIAFGLENKRVPHNRMQGLINKTADYLGITDLLKSATKDLSGGQKQLGAIASVLVMNPKFIVFDEVTSMLDYPSKQQIQKLMLSLRTTQKKTIINITHDIEEVINADKVIVMNRGKVVMVGKPLDIFKNSKFKKLSLDKPFMLKLAEQLGIKPTTNLDKLVKEISYEK
ncbi:MAG: energy-coupling factor transporter ATPase [Mycoplasmoidaceae bacterium]|nr:energy-coupling factor transporter ATPase [Mycoplasmoidaceae bacterium]